jgi:outer membrane lipoprotein-sorting protein
MPLRPASCGAARGGAPRDDGKKPQRSLLLVVAAIAAAMVACASFPAPKQPFTDPARALSFQSLARERVRSIRAEARIDQRGREGRIKGTVLMFVERPGRVRFDAMTQFGPAAVLTSDGQTFAYSDLRSKRYLTGATCPRNIARFLNVPLTIEQTTQLLLGGTPVIAHTRSSIAWNDEGFYRVVLHGAAGDRQEVDLGIREHDAELPPGSQELRLLRSELYDAKGKTDWRATYGEYQRLPLESYRVPMPFEVRVEQPRAGTDTLIRFKDIALNAQIPPEAFAQAPLPGMQEEVASCD